MISNNFILRPEDEAHIAEVGRLMLLPPAELITERPDIKYLLLRAKDYSIESNGERYLVADTPIATELFLAATPPPGFTLDMEIRWAAEDDSPTNIHARLFKVSHE